MMRIAQPKGAIDPRIERSRQLILRAALAELGEAGYGAFTIESVAVRAGSGKSTIYRHWPNKLALIADAFQTFHEQQAPDLGSGTPRERVERIVRHVADIASGSTFSACLPALIEGAERDRDLRKFHHRFQNRARRPLIAAIAEGVASGDFPAQADPELAALALLGVIFFRRLMTSTSFPPEHTGKLVAAVLPVAPDRRRSFGGRKRSGAVR